MWQARRILAGCARFGQDGWQGVERSDGWIVVVQGVIEERVGGSWDEWISRCLEYSASSLKNDLDNFSLMS